WRLHLPSGAPLEPGIDLGRFAALYPLPGGLIANAAAAAAFLGAAEGPVIRLRHLVHAVRREYAKAGQAFPGEPPLASVPDYPPGAVPVATP
ncbi:MAG TPA: hypothetical protein VJ010_06445, partial [Actinomycetota bacterium]|nr:hypothetical protein [Actinomycetota bacterium]